MHDHYKFQVAGPLNSYRHRRDEHWFSLVARIRQAADVAGVPRIIPNRCMAGLNLTFHWERGPRFDISNIVKLFEDALWKADSGIHQLVAQHMKREGFEFASVEVAIGRRLGRGKCTCNWMQTTTITQRRYTLSV